MRAQRRHDRAALGDRRQLGGHSRRPAVSVACGNPAVVVKRYDSTLKQWTRTAAHGLRDVTPESTGSRSICRGCGFRVDHHKLQPVNQPIRATSICLLSPSALPLVMGSAGRAGGAELDVWQIATALARDPAFRPILAAVGDDTARTTVAGVEVVSIARYRPERTRRGHFARYCGRVVRVLRECERRRLLLQRRVSRSRAVFRRGQVGRRRRFVFRLQHDWEASPATLTGTDLRGPAAPRAPLHDRASTGGCAFRADEDAAAAASG